MVSNESVKECDVFLCSPSLRSSRTARVLGTWWRSGHTGRRAGCRRPSRPLTPPDTSSRTRASSPSPSSRSKWASTTTRAKDRSDLWSPSTLQKRVGEALFILFLHLGICKTRLQSCALKISLFEPREQKNWKRTKDEIGQQCVRI